MEKIKKNLNPKPWFCQSFPFPVPVEELDKWRKNLDDFPKKLYAIVHHLPKEVLTYSAPKKWSIMEQIGHIYLLESLWQTRIQDILQGQNLMTMADLNNTATTTSNFNQSDLHILLTAFENKRKTTIEQLINIAPTDLQKTSLHPRLQTPMSIVDLSYFIYRHDHHHLRSMEVIIQILL